MLMVFFGWFKLCQVWNTLGNALCPVSRSNLCKEWDRYRWTWLESSHGWTALFSECLTVVSSGKKNIPNKSQVSASLHNNWMFVWLLLLVETTKWIIEKRCSYSRGFQTGALKDHRGFYLLTSWSVGHLGVHELGKLETGEASTLGKKYCGPLPFSTLSRPTHICSWVRLSQRVWKTLSYTKNTNFSLRLYGSSASHKKHNFILKCNLLSWMQVDCC